jgi:AAA family ATP:ADP antiporter
LVRSAEEGEEAQLRTLMVSPDWRTRGAALEVIAENTGEHGGRGPLELIDRPILDSLLAVEEEPDRADARGVVARAIGALGPGSPHTSRLEDLLLDPDPGVRAEAMAAASEIRDPRYLNHLLLALAKPRERKSARLALAAYGRPILPILGAVLDDETTDLNLRAQVPGAVGLMRIQPSVDFLLERSAHPLVVIRFQVIKALGKTRAWDLEQRLRFEPRVVEARLLEETRSHNELDAALSVWVGASGGGRRRRGDDGRTAPPETGGDSMAGGGALLRRALGERLDMNLERIFRLLGLRYPAEDMLFAYNGVVSKRQATRASAIEFLDNLLSSNLKRAVLPVIAGEEPDPLLPHERQIQPARNKEDVLRQLLSGNDSWLIACAIDAVQEMGLAGFERELAECRASRDPIVQEAAAAALGG